MLFLEGFCPEASLFYVPFLSNPGKNSGAVLTLISPNSGPMCIFKRYLKNNTSRETGPILQGL